MLAGRPSLATSSSIVFVAPPSDAPGARLKEIGATGNWPRGLTATGGDFASMGAKLLTGTICSRGPGRCAAGLVVPGTVGVDDDVGVDVAAVEVAGALPAPPPAGAA